MKVLTKITVARAQLLTALELFARDKDPVSTQCLACGGGEILEEMAVAQLRDETLIMSMIEAQPHLDRKKLRKIKHQYWNAFKHLTDREGLAREDDELLSQFSDTANDAALFVGWWDYMSIRKQLPIPAQVFQIWWLAINAQEYGLEKSMNGREAILATFPDIRQQPREEQKRRLRRAIERARKNPKVLAHPATETD